MLQKQAGFGVLSVSLCVGAHNRRRATESFHAPTLSVDVFIRRGFHSSKSSKSQRSNTKTTWLNENFQRHYKHLI